ncbi:MAG: isoprenyl transferase [Paludibacteraceae bacterium]|nr:isoprenyl transferase [Paludibacteraceae bacterium]
MNTPTQISTDNIPKHIAIIMDGNGRWAKKNGKPRIYGHRNALKAVREATETAAELGVRYLTLYAFSEENWNRPAAEVNGLMELLASAIETETTTLLNNNIRLLTIGHTDKLPATVAEQLGKSIERTAGNTGLTLILALSYSSHDEITEAAKSIAQDVKDGKIQIEDIDKELIGNRLYTKNIPNPELLIRTSGESRLSNFLLWQSAYTELYFTNLLWPDFRKSDLKEAILNYQNRERRFGKTSEQIKEEK